MDFEDEPSDDEDEGVSEEEDEDEEDEGSEEEHFEDALENLSLSDEKPRALVAVA